MSELTTKKKKGLGRGLEVLLGSSVPNFENESSVVSVLPMSCLKAGKYQPRTHMDESGLNELAESIKEQGIMQPILVRPIKEKDGKTYEIIAGERRFKASQIAGLLEIPIIIKDVDDKNAAAMALIENMQRENLNPLEEAQGIHRLIEDFGFTHEQAATAVGRSRSAVTNIVRLLNLTEPVQTMLMARDIDMGHARALLAVEGSLQIALATEIVAKRMSVREAEKLVSRSLEENKKRISQKPEYTADIVRLETELSDALATKVSFKLKSKGKGQIIIDFANLDVLDGLIHKMKH